jgi:hypothetical protein
MNVVLTFDSDTHFGLVNVAEHNTEQDGRDGSTFDLLWGGFWSDFDGDWHNPGCSLHVFLIPSIKCRKIL